MPGSADVERIVAVVVSALNCSCGNVTCWNMSVKTIIIMIIISPLEASTQVRSQLRGATRI